MSQRKLENLKPERVFYYFEEICAIPHGSRNTAQISEYVCNVATSLGYEAKMDSLGNVIVIKEATKGYENSKTVMLQGHLDMVCEKNQELKFDFKTEPLPISVMDDEVFSRGTTLGGDDGIAVAYILAILEDKTLEHPRLECVFTVDEEIGMLGATGIDLSDMKAGFLINIDSEDEGQFLTSCAGGVTSKCCVAVRRTKVTGVKYNMVVCGLKGGHSGTEIDKYRGNANIIMGRLLHFLGQKHSFSIVSLQGGLMDNAIPRESNCEILIDENECDIFENWMDEFESVIRNEFRANESNIQIYCENKGKTTESALSKKTQERVIFLLNTVPDGVQKMSMEIPGLVQTSLNFGIMRLSKDMFTLTAAVRSSIGSEKKYITDKLKYLTETIGGVYEERGEYPAWEFKEDSILREVMVKTYRDMFGKEAQVLGIHAGLECGIIAQKIPGIDVVSFGPDIMDIHTPKERLSVPSTQRMYSLLIEVLKRLK